MITNRSLSINRIQKLLDSDPNWTTPADIVADLMHYCDWQANDLNNPYGEWETVVDRAWKYFYDDTEWDEAAQNQVDF